MGNRRRSNRVAAVATAALSVTAAVSAFTPSSHSHCHRPLPVRHDPLHVLSNPNEDGLFKMETATTADVPESGLGGIVSKLNAKMGTVDDDRLIHPELFRKNDNGDDGNNNNNNADSVKRMFSSLEYSSLQQMDGNVRMTAVHNTGSVVAAATLIATTAVGAGVLALPSAVAEVGFLPSTVAMGVGWFYTTMSGLLIAELSINRLGTSGKPIHGLLDVYKDALPERLAPLGRGSFLFLQYALMTAFIAQGGANLTGLLDLPTGAGQVLMAAVCGSGLFLASPAAVNKANGVLRMGLAASFAGVIGMGASTANFGTLIALDNQHPELVAGAFPIIFMSLVFQNVVPKVVTQLEGDRDKITKAIIAGTTLPALAFLAWNAVMLGNVPSGATSADPVAVLQSAGGAMGGLVTTFSSLAVVTSLISVTNGIVEALGDTFKLETSADKERYRAPIFAMVFGLPLLLSLARPDVFHTALDFGGAFGVSTLFLVLPPLMVWRQRYGDEQMPLATKPMVPFGKISLGSMWKAAATLILEQGAEKLGVFEFIQEHVHLFASS